MNRAERRKRASIVRKIRLSPMPNRAPSEPLCDADPQAARAMLVEIFGAEHVEKRLGEIAAKAKR